MKETIQKMYTNIKEFFYNIFNKNKLMLEEPKEEVEAKNKSNEIKINSIDKLKQENKKRENIKEIVEITEKNPEVLNNLSVKQLKVIDNYYDESLEEINKKIAEFKATLKK